MYFGLSRVSITLPAPDWGRVGRRLGGRGHVQRICRQMAKWIQGRVVVVLGAVRAGRRRVDGTAVLTEAAELRAAVAGGRAVGAVQPAELGVHRDGDPDLAVERGAEGVLEAGAQPALDLVAGEVVGDRDDRGALVQRHRAAAGQPGPLVGRQVLDQGAPDPVQLGRTGAVGVLLAGGSLPKPSGRCRSGCHSRALRGMSPLQFNVVRGSARHTSWGRPDRSRARGPRAGGDRRHFGRAGRSTRLSTGCACCPDGWSSGPRTGDDPTPDLEKPRSEAFLSGKRTRAGTEREGVGTSTVGNLGTRER